MIYHPNSSQSDLYLAEKLPLQILLVEDIAVNQKFALLVLKKIGYQPDIVVNEQELFTALQLQSYHVIFINLEMPKMDGLAITQKIYQIGESNQRPYVIAMNTHSQLGDRLNSLPVGINDYINNPVQIKELFQALIKYRSYISTVQNQHNSNISPIDLTTLNSLQNMLGADEAAFIEVINCYLTESPKLLQILNLSLIEGDIQNLWQTAHKFKSSSASLGAKMLTQLCSELEKKGLSGNLEGSKTILHQLCQEYEQVKTALEKIQY
jgi:CheY-like chemotaxis protein/HPt (histidine-containing phosphotransfer) domain-containing protein